MVTEHRCSRVSVIYAAGSAQYILTSCRTLCLSVYRTPLESPAHPSRLAHHKQNAPHLRERLEHNYRLALLQAIPQELPQAQAPVRPKAQVLTCLDDRCEGLRRHTEEVGGAAIETFGVAGFFGLPTRFHPADGRAVETLAPVGVTPQLNLYEEPVPEQAEAHRRWKSRRRALAALSSLCDSLASLPVVGILLTGVMAPLSLLRLSLLSQPVLAARLESSLKGAPPNDMAMANGTFVRADLSTEGAAALLAPLFQDTGLAKAPLAPLVMVLGHGARSANNQYAAAYQCGACGGRDGGPNARLFAQLANTPAVRERLASHHAVEIPSDTVFVAGLHNTTEDKVTWFTHDVERALRGVPVGHSSTWDWAQAVMEDALGRHALERCQRFMVVNPEEPSKALHCVHRRAVDPSEVRPELNHASNGGLVVGRRALTRGAFLDRRAFLASYDPETDDHSGTRLERVLTPALLVGAGINLEYLFSTQDVAHSAGSKVPLNVVGNLGVMQGTTGDLRFGLPSQMTEMHVPNRAQVRGLSAVYLIAVIVSDGRTGSVESRGWVTHGRYWSLPLTSTLTVSDQ